MNHNVDDPPHPTPLPFFPTRTREPAALVERELGEVLEVLEGGDVACRSSTIFKVKGETFIGGGLTGQSTPPTLLPFFNTYP